MNTALKYLPALFVGIFIGIWVGGYMYSQAVPKPEPRQIMTTQMADGVRCYEFANQQYSPLSCVKVTP